MEQQPLPPLAAAMTGRTAVQTLRIALATALLAGKDMVEKADLEVAAEVVRYSVDTVLHIFGDQLGDERAQQQTIEPIDGCRFTGMRTDQTDPSITVLRAVHLRPRPRRGPLPHPQGPRQVEPALRRVRTRVPCGATSRCPRAGVTTWTAGADSRG